MPHEVNILQALSGEDHSAVQAEPVAIIKRIGFAGLRPLRLFRAPGSVGGAELNVPAETYWKQEGRNRRLGILAPKLLRRHGGSDIMTSH